MMIVCCRIVSFCTSNAIVTTAHVDCRSLQSTNNCNTWRRIMSHCCLFCWHNTNITMHACTLFL